MCSLTAVLSILKRPRARVLAIALATVGLSGCAAVRMTPPRVGAPGAGNFVFIPAADPRLQFSDGLRPVLLPDGAARFDRGLDTPGRGFRWDSPGSRLRWRTDSGVTRAHLRYTRLHTGSSRNSLGVFRVDRRANPKWIFTRPGNGDADVVVDLPVPAGGGAHDFEIILPYGDSVDVLGVDVLPAANFWPPAPRPPRRYLAFGDSVTHGFTGSDVTKSYAFRLAEAQGWELVNLGIGGRGAVGADGPVLAGIDADVVSVLIGVNDWQGGVELDEFREEFSVLLAGLSRACVNRPVYVITPLWVAPTWQPAGVTYPLERYRDIIRQVVADRRDPQLRLIEGPALIDHDPAFFDAIAVHPNDAGFFQMAERLAALMR